MTKENKIDIKNRVLAVVGNSKEFDETIEIYEKGMKSNDLKETKESLNWMFNMSNINMVRQNVLKLMKGDELGDDDKIWKYLDDYTEIYKMCLDEIFDKK